ncbi:MAG: hypothetical protein K2W96_11560 [Gemmataceae bacterium]|nr:hypothetical protein [Gemmataceae bacterium]
MAPLVTSYAMLAVSALYCAWNHYRLAQKKREEAMRRGVARLLWAAAVGDDE